MQRSKGWLLVNGQARLCAELSVVHCRMWRSLGDVVDEALISDDKGAVAKNAYKLRSKFSCGARNFLDQVHFF